MTKASIRYSSHMMAVSQVPPVNNSMKNKPKNRRVGTGLRHSWHPRIFYGPRFCPWCHFSWTNENFCFSKTEISPKQVHYVHPTEWKSGAGRHEGSFMNLGILSNFWLQYAISAILIGVSSRLLTRPCWNLVPGIFIMFVKSILTFTTRVAWIKNTFSGSSNQRWSAVLR